MKKLIVLSAFLFLKIVFLNVGYAQVKKNILYSDTLISLFLLNDIHLISSENTVYSATSGFAGNDNPHFAPFSNVNNLASNKDLEYLIYHPSPAVRCCAVYCLFSRKSDFLFNAIECLSTDTATFTNKFLGYNSKLKIVDYLYFKTYIKIVKFEYGNQLSKTQKRILRKERKKMKRLLSIQKTRKEYLKDRKF